jgi:acyl-CoA synthetase (AMP-forming)/AMP-acid ligase II
VIVNPDTDEELPDREAGEIWLQGNNIGRGYWGRPDETRLTFGAKLQSRIGKGSHTQGTLIGGTWLRTGDLGVSVSEVRFLPAGAVPRTTSGKLARRACRAEYLGGLLGVH